MLTTALVEEERQLATKLRQRNADLLEKCQARENWEQQLTAVQERINQLSANSVLTQTTQNDNQQSQIYTNFDIY